MASRSNDVVETKFSMRKRTRLNAENVTSSRTSYNGAYRSQIRLIWTVALVSAVMSSHKVNAFTVPSIQTSIQRYKNSRYHDYDYYYQTTTRNNALHMSFDFDHNTPSPRTWKQQTSPQKRLVKSDMTDNKNMSFNESMSKRVGTATNEETKAVPLAIPRSRAKMKPMPVTGYNAALIEEHYDRRPFQVVWRINSIGLPLLGWYLQLLIDKALGTSKNPLTQKRRGIELRHYLVQSKSVALIKSGQALSLRPDIMRNPIWAQELGKLVDAVGSFSDMEAMRIIRKELNDLCPRLAATRDTWQAAVNARIKQSRPRSRIEKLILSDDVLSLFDFDNNYKAVASASIGQVYKARIRPGPQLEAAIGKAEAAIWGGKTVAIKVQRPDVQESASLDMYLLRRSAMWLNKFRGGDLASIADAFGMQLFGELDYVREANNCDRFRQLYGGWKDVLVPAPCTALTRKRVLVMEWVDGTKGPWPGQDGLDMVGIGLRCSVDQLMTTGLFHADPHRGNLLKTPEGKLAFIDFGNVCDIREEDRYGLFGLTIGLQNKDLALITENLLKLGFLKDATQLDLLIPRLRAALLNATGGTGRASDVNFARLQAELDMISRDNLLFFTTPPFFTVIIRSLTILEGVALSVDPNFKLVRGAYPYVLSLLLSPDSDERIPAALQKLLIRLLTVNGEEKEIDWERLRDFLRLAQKASKSYVPSQAEQDDRGKLSRQTIELFGQFLTSKTGVFLKKPLVHELAEAIDGMASIGETNLLQWTNGLLPRLPGMQGPVNERRMDEIRKMVDTFRDAILVEGDDGSTKGQARMEAIMDLIRDFRLMLQDERVRNSSGPLLEEMQSVAQMVAVEVLEIRGSRAMRSLLRA